VLNYFLDHAEGDRQHTHFFIITTSVRRDLLAYVSCMDYILKRAKQQCIGKACLSDTVSFSV